MTLNQSTTDLEATGTNRSTEQTPVLGRCDSRDRGMSDSRTPDHVHDRRAHRRADDKSLKHARFPALAAQTPIGDQRIGRIVMLGTPEYCRWRASDGE
jgi:hypothetical protein